MWWRVQEVNQNRSSDQKKKKKEKRKRKRKRKEKEEEEEEGKKSAMLSAMQEYRTNAGSMQFQA
jgi:hypothetical protein